MVRIPLQMMHETFARWALPIAVVATEFGALAVLLALVVLIGVWPVWLLDFIEAAPVLPAPGGQDGG